MFNLVDKKGIEKFFSNPNHFNDVLMFELYGILNKHEIAHMDTYIDIRLIGAYIKNDFLNYISINYFSELYGFAKPDNIFSIEKLEDENSYSVRWQAQNTRLHNYEITSDVSFPTLYDAVQEVKVLLERINEEYLKCNGRRALEGVVINGQHVNRTQMYLKIKPHDIELEAKNPHGVARRFI